MYLARPLPSSSRNFIWVVRWLTLSFESSISFNLYSVSPSSSSASRGLATSRFLSIIFWNRKLPSSEYCSVFFRRAFFFRLRCFLLFPGSPVFFCEEPSFRAWKQMFTNSRVSISIWLNSFKWYFILKS